MTKRRGKKLPGPRCNFSDRGIVLVFMNAILVTGATGNVGRPLVTQLAAAGVEVRAYVHDLWRHLAVCDVAVVQGGLTTTMELVANRRPFLYVPLRHHFEQQFHVRHRLERHRAGRLVDYAETDPDALAAAMAVEVGRPVDYLAVPADGADRVAERLAELV